MANIITSIVSGPLGALVGGVKDLISQKLTNDHDKIEVSTKLAELNLAAEKAIIEADVKFAEMQQSVLVAEASSEHWLTSSWRPLGMLLFVGLVAYVILNGAFDVHGRAIPQVYVEWMFRIVELGFTGYVAGRSLEKIAPSIAEGIKAFKK